MTSQDKDFTSKVFDIYQSTAVKTDTLILHIILFCIIFSDLCKGLIMSISKTFTNNNLILKTKEEAIQKISSNVKNGSDKKGLNEAKLIWEVEYQHQLSNRESYEKNKRILMELTNKELRHKLNGRAGISRLKKSELVDLILKND